MSLAIKKDKDYPAIESLQIKEDLLTAYLSDGRVVSIPLAWFPKLSSADEKKINSFEISPSGYGIHWPDLDEDISIKAFLE